MSLSRGARLALGLGCLGAAATIGAVWGSAVPPASVAGGGARTILAGTLFLRAEALRKEGRVAELPAIYRRILELDPTSVRAIDHLADTLARDLLPLAPTPEGRLGWWREAIGLVDAGLATSDGDPRLRWRRADLLLSVGGAEPAVEAALTKEGRDRELEGLRDLRAAATSVGALPGIGRIHLETVARQAPRIAAERLATKRPGVDEALAIGADVLRLRPDDLGVLLLDPGSPWTAGDRLRAGLRLVAEVRDDLAAVPPRTAEARALLDVYAKQLGDDPVARAIRPLFP